MIRVLLVENETLVREGLRRVLEVDGAAQVAGEARDGQEALDRVRDVKPDVVLLDMRMPRLDGLGVLQALNGQPPSIVLTTFDDPDADPAPEITRRGLDKSCRVCSDTLDLWTAIYGAEAGNLALKVLALGGVYVAGGIAVKILEKMKDGTFFHAFKDKWKFEGLLSDIPVSIVLNESAPLLGAAYEALAAIDK